MRQEKGKGEVKGCVPFSKREYVGICPEETL